MRRWTRKRRGVLEEILGGALIPVGLVLLLVLFAALRASVELP